jgi:putative photosynthetic complex assembly protein
MSHVHHDEPLPKLALWAAAGLIGLSLLLAGTARLSGYGRTVLPTAAVVESRQLRFEDQRDGGIDVREAPGGARVALLPPGTNGFLRGVLRSLVRERRQELIGAAPPFRLTRWSDGRLSLEDPSTGRAVALEVFGPSNSVVFARLLERDGPKVTLNNSQPVWSTPDEHLQHP